MNHPKTLLTMAGANLTPAPISKSVVLIVDAQNEYLSGPLALNGIHESLEQIAALLARARSNQAPVIHIRHAGKTGGLFDLNASRGQIAALARPVDDETVIDKSLPNSFAHTDLHKILQEHADKALIVAGFMTHMCVSSTVRAALDLGYQSTVVASATATRDLPCSGKLGQSQSISATSLQQASLASLADRFALIVDDVNELTD